MSTIYISCQSEKQINADVLLDMTRPTWGRSASLALRSPPPLLLYVFTKSRFYLLASEHYPGSWEYTIFFSFTFANNLSPQPRGGSGVGDGPGAGGRKRAAPGQGGSRKRAKKAVSTCFLSFFLGVQILFAFGQPVGLVALL